MPVCSSASQTLSAIALSCEAWLRNTVCAEAWAPFTCFSPSPSPTSIPLQHQPVGGCIPLFKVFRASISIGAECRLSRKQIIAGIMAWFVALAGGTADYETLARQAESFGFYL